MEPDDEKKKLNDDVVVFMRKRSETEAPRYTARLKTYVDIQQKHRRAAVARRHTEHGYGKLSSASRKKVDNEQKQQATENMPISASREYPANNEDGASRRGRIGEKGVHRTRSFSRSGSADEPSDRCGRRRRRRRSCCRRRRRRRSRRRRRRSCRRRRRSRRRRRRSRRRRRRSCRRRRPRRRRCR